MSERAFPPGYDPALPFGYNSEQPEARVERVLREFANALPAERLFEISFHRSVSDLIAEAERLSPQHQSIAQTLLRIHAAVYALLDVEWKAGRIKPYSEYTIAFQANSRFPRGHPPPALWLQHFDIIVHSTNLDESPERTGLRHLVRTRMNNIGQSGPLPSLPLSQRRGSGHSGVRAETAIDSRLRTCDLTRKAPKPDHLYWFDRFTKADSDPSVPPGTWTHEVWWQWSTSQEASTDRSADFVQRRSPSMARFAESRTDPAILLVFPDPFEPQPRLPREAGGVSVLSRR